MGGRRRGAGGEAAMDSWEGAFGWQGYASEGRPDLLNYLYRGDVTPVEVVQEVGAPFGSIPLPAEGTFPGVHGCLPASPTPPPAHLDRGLRRLDHSRQ